MAVPPRPRRWGESSRLPIDLELTLGPLRRGRADPCMRIGPTEAWRAFHTPVGPATLHVEVSASDAELTAEAWGPGSEWAIEHARGFVGLDDDPTALVTDHPLVARLVSSMPSLRLTATGVVYDVAVQTVLEQRVTGKESKRSWRRLVWRHGEPAPGPVSVEQLRLAPPPEAVAALADWERHRLGIERQRGVTMSLVAGERDRLERAAVAPPPALARRLRSVPGVGPWTTSLVTHYTQGDPDAVLVGDFHICHDVVHAFTGRTRGSDEEMLEVLEPFRGQRARVVRLVVAGAPSRPRRAPKVEIPDRILAEDARRPPARPRPRS